MIAQLDRDIFGDLLSRKEPAGTRRYYHFDGLGSTTALSDAGGAAVATLLYDAWGNQRAASGDTVSNYRFTGAELDSASGLYHMGARFYDPSVGRWLLEDPHQDRHYEPLGLNFYAYVVNNPILLTDLDGNEETCMSPTAVYTSGDGGECGGGGGGSGGGGSGKSRRRKPSTPGVPSTRSLAETTQRAWGGTVKEARGQGWTWTGERNGRTVTIRFMDRGEAGRNRTLRSRSEPPAPMER
jgi:RHS repeat-associated protein